MKTFNLFRSAIRKLSDISTELLRAGEKDLMSEIQTMTIRLIEIQEELSKKQEQ